MTAHLTLIIAAIGACVYILVPDTDRWPRLGRVGFYVFVLAFAAWLLAGGAGQAVNIP